MINFGKGNYKNMIHFVKVVNNVKPCLEFKSFEIIGKNKVKMYKYFRKVSTINQLIVTFN